MDTRLLSFLEPAMGLVRGKLNSSRSPAIRPLKILTASSAASWSPFTNYMSTTLSSWAMTTAACSRRRQTACAVTWQKKASLTRLLLLSGPSWNNGPTPLPISMRPSVIRSAACGPIPTCLHPLRFMVWSSIRTPVKSESSTMEKARNRRYYESCHTTNERPCRCPRSDDGFDSGY